MKDITRINKSRCIKLNATDIIDLLNKIGYNISSAEVTFKVPGDGDWSYTSIEVDNDNPIEVSWEENYEE